MPTALTLPSAHLPPPSNADALVAHLTQVQRQPEGHTVLLEPAEARGLLSQLSQWPFDPNARVPCVAPNRNSALRPVLAHVLSRLPPTRPVPPCPAAAWPSTVDAFGAAWWGAWKDPDRPGGGEAVDGEWLAAVLLAAGANPWADRTPKAPWGESLPSALERGYGRLACRMMETAGGPSWDEVARMPCPKAVNGVSGFVPKTWWTAVAASPSLLPVFEQVMHHAVPWPTQGPHPLDHVAPQTLGVAARYGRLPTQATEVRRLRTAWGARLRANQIPAATFTQMEAVLAGSPDGASPTPPDAERTRESQALQALTKHGWGSQSYGLPRHPHAQSPTAAQWCERVEVTGATAVRGTWSRLAIEWMQALRGCRQGQWDSLPAMPLQAWLANPSFDPQVNRGALTPAIDFEWRPGIPMAGLAWLMTHGARMDPIPKQGNLSVLGVDDETVWTQRHLPSAVAFTQAVLQRASGKAHSNLLRVWLVAVEVAAVRQALYAQPSETLTLFRALHNQFYGEGMMVDLWQRLSDPHCSRPRFARPPDVLSNHVWLATEPPWRLVEWEVGLGTRSLEWLEQTANKGLQASELERLEAWLDVMSKRWWRTGEKETLDRLKIVAKQARLDIRWPASASGRSSSRL